MFGKASIFRAGKVIYATLLLDAAVLPAIAMPEAGGPESGFDGDTTAVTVDNPGSSDLSLQPSIFDPAGHIDLIDSLIHELGNPGDAQVELEHIGIKAQNLLKCHLFGGVLDDKEQIAAINLLYSGDSGASSDEISYLLDTVIDQEQERSGPLRAAAARAISTFRISSADTVNGSKVDELFRIVNQKDTPESVGEALVGCYSKWNSHEQLLTIACNREISSNVRSSAVFYLSEHALSATALIHLESLYRDTDESPDVRASAQALLLVKKWFNAPEDLIGIVLSEDTLVPVDNRLLATDLLFGGDVAADQPLECLAGQVFSRLSEANGVNLQVKVSILDRLEELGFSDIPATLRLIKDAADTGDGRSWLSLNRIFSRVIESGLRAEDFTLTESHLISLLEHSHPETWRLYVWNPERFNEHIDVAMALNSDETDSLLWTLLRDPPANLPPKCFDALAERLAVSDQERVDKVLKDRSCEEINSVPVAEGELATEVKPCSDPGDLLSDSGLQEGDLGARWEAGLRSPYEEVQFKAAKALFSRGERIADRIMFEALRSRFMDEALSTLVQCGDSRHSLMIYNCIISDYKNNADARRKLQGILAVDEVAETFFDSLRQSAAIGVLEGSAEISSYAAAYRACRDLGISNPLRFAPGELIQIVETRKALQNGKRDTDSINTVIFLGRDDFNGAFFQNAQQYQVISNSGKVLYFEASSDSEFVSECKQLMARGVQASLLIVGGHGSQVTLGLGSDELGGPENRYGQTIDLGDEDMLEMSGIGRLLCEGGQFFSYSCSNGADGFIKGVDDNLLRMWRRVFPHASEVIGFDRPGSLTGIDMDRSGFKGLKATAGLRIL